jgi:pilus assembly protein Flp/PilA
VDVVKYWRQLVVPYLRARYGRNEQGAAIVEYALLVAFIAILCVAAVAFLGNAVANKFSGVGSGVSN